jgi:hypothetical protein
MSTDSKMYEALRSFGFADSELAFCRPPKRRKAAHCRNRRGSALRPEGACTEPKYRVYEKQHDGRWKLLFNVCAKCIASELEWMSADLHRVKEIQ